MTDDGQETPTFEEILGDTPSEKLDQPCQDEHLGEIARHVTNWFTLVPFLGVSEAEEKEIRGNWPTDTAKQKIDFFRKWQEKRGRKATYRRLCEGIWKDGKVRLVEKVCSILCRQESSSESSSDNEAIPEAPPAAKKPKLSSTSEVDPLAMERYAEHLRGVFDPQCPSRSTGKIVNLTITRAQEVIQRTLPNENMVRLLMEGKFCNVKQIKVADLFDREFHPSEGCKIALVEGPPGGGKTVLAQDIYQKWRSEKMFHKLFKLVIFIQLQDSRVQSATSLAELLHPPSSLKSDDVVAQMQQVKGRKVLFIVDGWDQLRPELCENSLFNTLICNPRDLKLKHCTVLVTSRPFASADVQQHASARFEIVGFGQEDIRHYFGSVLGDPLAVQKVRPDVETSCYLPQTAEVVVNVFKQRDLTRPTTLFHVFEPVVCGCIHRYLKRTSGVGKEIPSLADLPSSIQGDFQKICELAYKGSMANKVAFSVQDLESYELPAEINVLDLMQVVPSRDSKLWHFLNLPVQGLLTALYISKLPSRQQVGIFKRFVDSHFAGFHQFYAAITKLKDEGVREFVAQVVRECRPFNNLLAILHCLYEAQDSSLCHFVATQLNGQLDLCNTAIEPLDCLVVGYFLGFIGMNTTSGRFEADLRSRSFNQHSFYFFVRGLSQYTDCNSASAEGLKFSRHASSFPGLKLIVAGNGIGLTVLVNLGNEVKPDSGLVAIRCFSMDVTNNGVQLGKMLSNNKTLKELEFHYVGFRETTSLKALLTTLD